MEIPIQGLIEIFCRGCGRSIGRHPYQGFKTVSECGNCLVGDGFERPAEWPDEGKFYGRDVGTTTEDLVRNNQSLSRNDTGSGVIEKQQKKRKAWMKKDQGSTA